MFESTSCARALISRVFLNKEGSIINEKEGLRTDLPKVVSGKFDDR
jgi:hypothetical protein